MLLPRGRDEPGLFVPLQSLRDYNTIRTCPGVETPGYCQVSLRDGDCRLKAAFRIRPERRIYAAGGGPGRNPSCRRAPYRRLFGDLPTKLWNPQVQSSGAGFGVLTNQIRLRACPAALLTAWSSSFKAFVSSGMADLFASAWSTRA